MVRRLFLIVGLALIGAGALVLADYVMVARADGAFEIMVDFDPPPSEKARVSYALMHSKFLPLYLARELPVELQSEFVEIRDPAEGRIPIRVPFSCRITGLLGREYGYTQPDDTLLVRFEPEEGEAYYATARLPQRDQPRTVVVAGRRSRD